MQPWNVILTIRPGSSHSSELITELRRLGDFHDTAFHDVLAGLVAKQREFLDRLADAREARAPWAEDVKRVIPVERVFIFTPDDLVEQWSESLPGYLDRMPPRATCFVRLERRGLVGQLHSVAVERMVADRLFDLAETRGVRLGVSFNDPDYIVLAETMANQCGLALITRELRQRYPFIHVK